ncbi:hypothetical protein C2G38_2120806 [Gigaspora rosea]|uniref:Uncharacterized protein n=1 Tax=Gigaspora rosea TaxID=44941 RepID=A0A397UAP3_9GLOM|nr:hypothetical protein C2G38_2120806 [Gigaspora rosea]
MLYLIFSLKPIIYVTCLIINLKICTNNKDTNNVTIKSFENSILNVINFAFFKKLDMLISKSIFCILYNLVMYCI